MPRPENRLVNSTAAAAAAIRHSIGSPATPESSVRERICENHRPEGGWEGHAPIRPASKIPIRTETLARDRALVRSRVLHSLVSSCFHARDFLDDENPEQSRTVLLLLE